MLLFASCTCAAMAAWALAPGHTPSRQALASVAAVLVIVSSWSLVRIPAVRLLWDGERWQLSANGSPGRDATDGELRLMLDLGIWMLLRFRAADGQVRGPRVRWLPVQRGGLEPQWSALRRALYSPRPAPGPAAAADPRSPPE